MQQGRIDDAIAYAETQHKGEHHYKSQEILAFCEQTLIDASRSDEAYAKYGLVASQATTNLATHRNILKKYPERCPRQVLLDLIEAHAPKGKWFAAAKDAGCLDVALQCAANHMADPATLIRAARDFTEKDSVFAAQVAVCAVKNLLDGGGYEPTTLDMKDAYQHLMNASEKCGRMDWALAEVDQLIAQGTSSDRQGLLSALVGVRQRQV